MYTYVNGEAGCASVGPDVAMPQPVVKFTYEGYRTALASTTSSRLEAARPGPWREENGAARGGRSASVADVATVRRRP